MERDSARRDSTRSESTRSDYIPSPSSNLQLEYLWNNAKLKHLFLKIINGGQLRDCRSVQKFVDETVTKMVAKKKKDSEIYAALHNRLHTEPSPVKDEYKKHHPEGFVPTEGRANSRVRQVSLI